MSSHTAPSSVPLPSRPPRRVRSHFGGLDVLKAILAWVGAYVLIGILAVGSLALLAMLALRFALSATGH